VDIDVFRPAFRHFHYYYYYYYLSLGYLLPTVNAAQHITPTHRNEFSTSRLSKVKSRNASQTARQTARQAKCTAIVRIRGWLTDHQIILYADELHNVRSVVVGATVKNKLRTIRQ